MGSRTPKSKVSRPPFEAVQSRPVQPKEERFTRPRLDGVELRALHWGIVGRPVVVLLHGAGANAHWWDHLSPALAERFHVVALDFRGHGDSDYPTRYQPGAFNDDLEALLEHLGAPDASLVGHSLGGHVALAHAAGCGGTTPALALIDVSRGVSASRRRATRLALTLRRTYRSREEAVRRFRFLPGAAHADEALRAAIAEHSVRREPDGRFGFKFDERWFAVRAGERPELSRVRARTLLLRGAQSKLLTGEAAAEMASEIQAARLVEISDAGHHVHIDQPEATLTELQGFL